MFVAVIPPDEVIEDLEEFLAPRREAAAYRWTPAEQWHVTLAFAEHVPDRAYDELVDHLHAATAKRSPMRMRLVGGGAFPDPARARVLFAALDTDVDELGRTAIGARNAMSTAGVRIDGQRFRPHVTLARMNRAVEATGWVRVLDAYRGPGWTVDEIALLASHLGEGPRGRPRHEVVGTFSLGPAGSGPGRPDAPPRGR